MLSVPLYNARGKAYTDVVTVTVAPMLLGGTIGTTGTVSYNSSVTLNNQLVGTGGNCKGQYIYQWQQSFDGGPLQMP